MKYILICSGEDCLIRTRCTMYDNYIYNTIKLPEYEEYVNYIEPEYDSNADYCKNFGLEET